MSHIVSLNGELLNLIFDNIKSIKQLSVCRLVCKAWSEPAAKAMLGRTIVIKTERKAINLYKHLVMDSSKAKYIKHMHFVFDGAQLPVIVEELLGIALTHNIERISGSVEPDVFFTTMYDMMNSRIFDNSKLKQMPIYTGASTATRIKRLSLIRHSVKSIGIILGDNRNSDTSEFIKQLENCKRLSYLQVQGFVKRMGELEIILNCCPHLLTLQIQDFNLEDVIYYQTLPKENVDAWTNARVKQQNQLEALSMVDTKCRPELLEYLVFKYVNIKKLVITGSLWLASDEQNLGSGNLDRILDAISEINSVKLSLILPADTSLLDAALFTRGRIEDIRYEAEEIHGAQEMVIKAEW